MPNFTNMCTLVTSTLPFSAQICVLRPLNVKNAKTFTLLKLIFSLSKTMEEVSWTTGMCVSCDVCWLGTNRYVQWSAIWLPICHHRGFEIQGLFLRSWKQVNSLLIIFMKFSRLFRRLSWGCHSSAPIQKSLFHVASKNAHRWTQAEVKETVMDWLKGLALISMTRGSSGSWSVWMNVWIAMGTM
jgi:hypothetical protein